MDDYGHQHFKIKFEFINRIREEANSRLLGFSRRYDRNCLRFIARRGDCIIRRYPDSKHECWSRR